MATVIAVLETMWDWRSMTSNAGYQEAPRYFRINPDNHSGRRLYRLIGIGHELWVTNACRELVRSASDHGRPDPAWLHENLTMLIGQFQPRLILVCGKVAQETFSRCSYILPATTTTLHIAHPAARSWTIANLASVTAEIGDHLHE